MRPIALIGLVFFAVSADASTSKTYPCGFCRPALTPVVVSSQVSHVPHGVGIPAQFVSVPFKLIQSDRNAPVAASTTSVVVPPGARLSHAVFGSPITVPGGMSLPSPSSWLRTRRSVPLPSVEHRHAVVDRRA